MGPEGHRERGSSLTDYVGIIRRRAWVVALTVILLPLAAIAFSLRQEALYQASADVLVKRQNLASVLSGIPETYEEPERFIQTQIDLARVPALAERVLRSVRSQPRDTGAFLRNSSVTASTNSDLISFSVTDQDEARATRLATEYARQYTLYRRQLDTTSVKRARREVERLIRQLGQPPSRNAPTYESYASLLERRGQLQTLEALQTDNASLARRADGATKVQPRPLRNAVVGLGLGLFFGIGLALLWHALDTRLHSAEEVGDQLGLTLLGRLPPPSKQLRRDSGIAMLTEPRGATAEAFRVLRTNLEFANLQYTGRTIMVTSAVQGEGKSTTVANLAVAFARAGRLVSVVDLDLRRPSLHRFFRLEGRPGLTDVALGHESLVEAFATVPLPGEVPAAEGSRNGRSRAEVGVIKVLPSGPVPPDPGEFVGTAALADVLAEVKERSDIVLIDSPPLLHLGDARVLSGQVDGIIVVTRLNLVRRQMLRELRRVLERSPAAKLGFVVTGSEAGEDYGYSGYYAGEPRAAKEPVG